MAQPGAIIGLADCLKKEAQGPANTYICFNFLSQSAEPSTVYSRQRSPKWGAQKNIRMFILLQNPFHRAYLKCLRPLSGFLFVCSF